MWEVGVYLVDVKIGIKDVGDFKNQWEVMLFGVGIYSR